MARMLAAATLLLLLVGCGGDDDDDATSGSPSAPAASLSATTGPTSATTEAASTSADSTTVPATQPSSEDGPTPASVAQALTDAGLGCEDIHPPDPSETSATLLPEPEGEEGECTVRGHPVTISVLADSDAVEMAEAQLETVLPEFLKGFGIDEFQVVRTGPDDRVIITVNNADSTSLQLTDEQRAINEEIAEALDGEVITIES